MTLLKWIHRCNSFTNEHLSVAIKNRRDSKGMQQVIAAQRSPGSASNKTAALHIVWPGFGTCFFWQAGIMSRLSEEFRMAHVPTIASSGGGLVAVLGACEVPPAEAVRLAFRLCREAGVYDRPMGLLGIWRNLVHRWLDGLLPADAASRCTHVRLVVTELPSLQPLQLNGWNCRDDLISAALASAHIPLVLDGTWATRCRNRLVLDGNLHYAWLRRPQGLVPPGPSLVFDPRDDPHLQRELGGGFGAWVRRMDDRRAFHMIELGRRHYDSLVERGMLDRHALRAQYGRLRTSTSAGLSSVRHT
ncbi:hypothetical protein Vretimale_14753 [Volvox reticuliferus]|uniref:PNPLA domain-containing protein n=1 Tax=Volvox reticuliferus TaxID=1737510 RepID=A0A8J4CVD8_9CHLO|nr:hypothetical protein Vretifemale_15606 [Volvox reticuliferus]GIM11203.1 hypothetical protein Vretimale_14753 [Volvox reticuliferus]